MGSRTENMERWILILYRQACRQGRPDVAEHADGGIKFDENFFVDWPKGHRPHQVRLEGGDCSSDSYCYP